MAGGGASSSPAWPAVHLLPQRAGTVPGGRRADGHRTPRLILHRAVPGPQFRNGGTIRHGTVPCRAMPVPVLCRVVRLAKYSWLTTN